MSEAIGYTADEIGSVPDGADLGLGCGNPVALASIQEGFHVLDLGAGGGFDCFLAAKKAGERGHIIGVDMTPDMIEKARGNAEKGEYKNVEFRLGEIEHLPVEDSSIDMVISNCVINLSVDKQQVFNEIGRVLKPGGTFMVSDIVANEELPEAVRNSLEAYSGCIAGAMLKNEYLGTIEKAGLEDVHITSEKSFGGSVGKDDESEDLAYSLSSVTVTGNKPQN